MDIQPTALSLATMLILSGSANAAPCQLSKLTIEASRNGVAQNRIVSAFNNGRTSFSEISPYSFTDSATVKTNSMGEVVAHEDTRAVVEVGFKGSASCSGDRALVEFSHTDLVGGQTVPMALVDTPSNPPIVDSFKTTIVVSGTPGSEPVHRSMGTWIYLIHAE